MPETLDVEELKPGLIIFRRGDVQHRRWYCRLKVPDEDRYKTHSLKTIDIETAKNRAYDHDAELRFKVKHEMPVFNRTFAQVAQEYSDKEKGRAEVGQITLHRWRIQDSHIRTQLNRFLGKHQITLIGQDRWQEYPVWRQRNGKGRSGDKVSDATIRTEMATLKSVMLYAASKQYIRDSQVFKGKIPISKARREEFTPQEYRQLHTFARKWVKEARGDNNEWYRTVAYNFLLIMCNTGMRPSEAKNLLWKDVDIQTDKHGRQFVRLAVRGKGKHRNLVAASNVATYFERIKEISKAAKPDDWVFTTDKGDRARTLYHSLIERLLIESKLQKSSSGSRRSTYCFRHTYATFRLTEGVDVYFLAKQMGTSVKMIEDHYGHVNPVKNAERILQGLPGWESITPPAIDRAEDEDGGKGKKK
ncbi:MAG: tyrosine-type recombinase/integrase [Alphaproteobacteria bacterium]|nr:tyrosine-type recombinase/integrase [Alphaproteobacteria bacterium]